MIPLILFFTFYLCFFSEGGFISSAVRPSSSSSGTGLAATGRNYVDDDMSSSIYDIPAYDTESSLVIFYNYIIICYRA